MVFRSHIECSFTLSALTEFDLKKKSTFAHMHGSFCVHFHMQISSVQRDIYVLEKAHTCSSTLEKFPQCTQHHVPCVGQCWQMFRFEPLVHHCFFCPDVTFPVGILQLNGTADHDGESGCCSCSFLVISHNCSYW